ncbi:MAG: glycosyltransferase [Gemmatimonadota bacterium]
MSLIFPGIRIHSILFFPFVRMSRRDIGKARGFLGKIKFLRKKWLLKFATRFSRLGTVFVLNDKEAVRRLNHLLGQADPIVRFLPDPVPVWEGSGGALRPSEKCTFLMIGALRRRKGVFEVLEAFRMLNDKEALRDAKLILAGDPTREDRNALVSAVEALRAQCPDLEVETQFRKLSEAEFVDRFAESTVVLVPYTRPEGSSGILGHAARANRPVVGPRDGLIGDLIRDYDLGYTLDDVSAESLSAYFERAISSAGDLASSPRQREFVEERKPENFARILLNAAC